MRQDELAKRLYAGLLSKGECDGVTLASLGFVSGASAIRAPKVTDRMSVLQHYVSRKLRSKC